MWPLCLAGTCERDTCAGACACPHIILRPHARSLTLDARLSSPPVPKATISLANHECNPPQAKEQAKAMMHGVETMVRTEVETMLLHGLPQEELQVRDCGGGAGLGAGCGVEGGVGGWGRRHVGAGAGVRAGVGGWEDGKVSGGGRGQVGEGGAWACVPYVRTGMCVAPLASHSTDMRCGATAHVLTNTRTHALIIPAGMTRPGSDAQGVQEGRRRRQRAAQPVSPALWCRQTPRGPGAGGCWGL